MQVAINFLLTIYYICIGTSYKAYSIAYFNRLVLSCESTEGTLASEALLN